MQISEYAAKAEPFPQVCTLHNPLLEELPMTFQVGLVGRDGILLASDRAVSESSAIVPARLTSEQDKLIVLKPRGWAYCCAGGAFPVEAMQALTMGIADGMNPQLGITDKLILAAQLTLQKAEGRIDFVMNYGSVLFVEKEGSGLQLLKLEINWPKSSLAPVKCCRVCSKTAQGDEGNTARFFLERYYDKAKTVEQLVPLAVHAVCMAHEVNPKGVFGLDVGVFTHSRFELLTNAQLSKAMRISEELDSNTAKVLSQSPAID